MQTSRRITPVFVANRNGFTLVELLIVVSIMALLLTMTLMAVNFSRDSERVVSAALQVQSMLSGARDRAIYAREPRGVRFFVDQDNYRAVTSMVYIDPSEYWDKGNIQLQRPDIAPNDNVADSANVTVVAGAQVHWWELKRRGLLFDGLRVRIPKGTTGTWYTISTQLIDITNPPSATQYLVLQIPYADPGDTKVTSVKAFDSGGPEDYELELPARILPMDPVKLPADTIIDLDGSKLPPSWRPSFAVGSAGTGNAQYSQFMDVVFSARGTVIGGAAAGGVIHFYICDSVDSLSLKDEFVKSLTPYTPLPPGAPPTLTLSANGQNIPTGQVLTFNALLQAGNYFVPTNEIYTANAPWLPEHDTDPYLVRNRRVVSIFTQTGAVSSSQIYVNDADSDGNENDPFRYAETGETAK
ncbi:MAG TPA: prepilin-type N-terminal cleavage/methylation domain-containing protein [Planctomycetaceae bacterium]|nr:prepilin-type N-terminal cleavage/methylation domain-containing protein [Planctomycetaceae bacterium]